MNDLKNPCEDCHGTGRDERKTRALAAKDADFRHRAKHHGSYVRCWTCNGNGVDPTTLYTWTAPKQENPNG